MNNQRGISLLEILIGVTILAITLSIAAGVFSSTIRYRQKADASRTIDQDVRSVVKAIEDDVRSSNGLIGTVGSRYYYCVAGYDNFLLEQGAPNNYQKESKVLRVNLDDNHRRQYYLSGDGQVIAQDLIYNVGQGWSANGGAQSISGTDVEVSKLTFRVNSASRIKNLNNYSSNGQSYPWVEVKLSAKYKDLRNRPEFKGEKVQLETVVSPRNFNFID